MALLNSVSVSVNEWTTIYSFTGEEKSLTISLCNRGGLSCDITADSLNLIITEIR